MRIHPRLKVLAWALLVLAAVMGGLTYWALRLEPFLRDAVGTFLRTQTLAIIRNSRDEKLTVTLGRFNFNLARGRLVIDTVAVAYDDSTARAVERLRATAPRVVLTGISVTDIVFRRRVILSGVEIERPVLYRQEQVRPDSATRLSQPPPRDTAAPARQQLADPDSYSLHGFGTELYGIVIEWLPKDLEASRVALVKVDRADVTLVTGEPGREKQTLISDLVVELKGIGVDAKAQRLVHDVWISCPRFQLRARGRAVDVHGVALRINAADSAATIDSAFAELDASYRLLAWQVERSYAEGTFSMRRLSLQPRLDDAAFFRAARTRATRVRVDASDIVISGMASGSALVGQTAARLVEIGDLQLDAAVDKRYPPRRRRGATVMPPQAFAALPWGVHVDTLVLKGGEVRYTEIQPTGEASRIRFARLSARITGLANWDPTGPIEVAARGHMYDAGAIEASFTIPVHRSRFQLEVHGTWEGMPLQRLNEFIVHSSGARITDGTAGPTRFRFTVANSVARGTLSPTWTDLKVELVNKESGKANLGRKLLSFVARTFVVRSANAPSEKKYRAGYPIHYQVEPTDTFFGMLWKSVRSAVIPAMKK